eukprot:2054579-Rhodomonas_salina.2
MCGNLDIDPETLEASYYVQHPAAPSLPLGDSSLLDTATATGNSSLVRLPAASPTPPPHSELRALVSGASLKGLWPWLCACRGH